MKTLTLAAMVVIGLYGRPEAAALCKKAMGDQTLIMVIGTFQDGDADRFADASQGLSNVVVAFQSPGGDAREGIMMSATIREREFTTYVGNGATCASACAIAWLGGAQRAMSARARVGFHAVYRRTAYGTEDSGNGNAVLGAYLSELGLPLTAIAYVTSESGPNNVAWLTPAKAREIGIDVDVVEIPDVAPPVAQPARPPQRPVYAPRPQYRQPTQAEQAAIAFRMFGMMVCAMSGRC